MTTLQAARWFSNNNSDRVTFPVDFAVVCLSSVIGLLLTALALALGFGAEIGQALSLAG